MDSQQKKKKKMYIRNVFFEHYVNYVHGFTKYVVQSWGKVDTSSILYTEM